MVKTILITGATDGMHFLILKTFFPASRNHIPPKSLGYRTPHQVFSELVRLSSLI